MRRKKSGDGHTYVFREGFLAAIKAKGVTFSAPGKKVRVPQLPDTRATLSSLSMLGGACAMLFLLETPRQAE